MWIITLVISAVKMRQTYMRIDTPQVAAPELPVCVGELQGAALSWHPESSGLDPSVLPDQAGVPGSLRLLQLAGQQHHLPGHPHSSEVSSPEEYS